MTKSTDLTKWPKGINNTHSEAREIDLTKVSSFLLELGYSVIQLDQRWRHIHGIVESENSKYFFKLSSTSEIGAKTENEVRWNEEVAEKLLVISGGTLIVPKIHKTGAYQGNFFYLADFYDGEFPADHDPPRTELLPQYLPSLVDVALHLNNLRSDALWDTEEDKSSQALIKRFFKEVDRWQRDSGREDLGELRTLVEPLEVNYHPRISHGDFVPWHILLRGKERILIDGEHAWVGRSKYYDVAYFYHRLSTSAARPDLARKFISEFQKGLPKSEQADFKDVFIPLIASRSIAGFYDATLFEDQKKVLNKHEELKNMILAQDLW